MSFSRFLVFVPVVCLLAQPPAPRPADPAKPGVVVNGSGAPPPPNVRAEIMKPTDAKLPDVPPDKVVLTIGNEKITAGEFTQFIETLPENVQGQARGPARRQLAENLVKIKLLAQQARRDKADQDQLFKVSESYQVDNLLAIYFINKYMKTAKVGDAELRDYYEQHKKDYETIRARHILIRFKGSKVPLKNGEKDLTDEEALARAQDIRKRLAAGADFAQVAKQESDDTGSAANGGDVGEFRHGMMVAEFDQAASTLPLGEISQPVKTVFGYHIIQTQSRQARTFDEVKDEIEKKLHPQMADKYISDLRSKGTVLIDDSYFPPTPAPAAPAPGAQVTVTPK